MSYPNSFKNTIIPNPKSKIDDEVDSSHRSGNNMFCDFVKERVPEIENTDEKGWKSILARLLKTAPSFNKNAKGGNLVPLNRKNTGSQKTHAEGAEPIVEKTKTRGGGGGNIRRRRHRKRTTIIRKNKKTRLSYINNKTKKRKSNK